jgi:hypothetical protein
MDENSPVMHYGPRMELCWKRIEGFFPDKLHKMVASQKYDYDLRTVAEPRGWLRVASATPGKIKNY